MDANANAGLLPLIEQHALLHGDLNPKAPRELLERMNRTGEVGSIILGQMRACLSQGELQGKTVLDFGCGQGASTLMMAEEFPDTSFVGVELEQAHVDLALKLASAKGLANVRFLCSPDGEHLPAELGGVSFDAITLSAVYEHLLPAERRMVLPLLWRSLKVGGILFLNQTPHSWFPFEHHSTGLWGINYLPDGAAHWVARKFGRMNKRISNSPDWNVQLRGGIRGGDEHDVLGDITRGGGAATIVQPRYGARDRAEYWLNGTSAKYRAAKILISLVFRVCDRMWGVVPSMNMELALRKDR